MAPSARLANGRMPMNATDQTAMMRPRSCAPIRRYIIVDVRVCDAR